MHAVAALPPRNKYLVHLKDGRTIKVDATTFAKTSDCYYIFSDLNKEDLNKALNSGKSAGISVYEIRASLVFSVELEGATSFVPKPRTAARKGR
jgi:hypothetical protein